MENQIENGKLRSPYGGRIGIIEMSTERYVKCISRMFSTMKNQIENAMANAVETGFNWGFTSGTHREQFPIV